jgi:diguanylate cyclase (GGDEF)-like protein/PAS domain S-box-containing protein
MNRLAATYRLSFALAMISTAPIVICSFIASWRESHVAAQTRMLACEQFGLLCSVHLQRGNQASLEEISRQLLGRERTLSGIRIVGVSGNIILQAGEVPKVTQDKNSKQSGSTRVAASLYRFQKPWAALEFYYRSPANQGVMIQLLSPLALALLINFPLFIITLRRCLSVVDTSRVVPTRVRNTLDTIPDGIAIADAHGRIIVVNEAFQKNSGRDADKLIGSGINSLDFEPLEEQLPWHHPDKSVRSIVGVKVQLKLAEGIGYFNLGCSPIFDANEKHAGNLISVQDITELENQKRILEGTLTELEESKERLSERNTQLQELATKDMLTGVYNRRYLIEQLEQTWEQCQNNRWPMSVFMLDVDRFKLLNDNHGHAVGDRVLRDVAAVLKSSVSLSGMVARYGGEEFCAVLPNLNAQQATVIAETVRKNIESQLELPYHVTASLGVSCSQFGASNYQEMLEQADQSLYSAKHGGRNAVCCWDTIKDRKEDTSKPLEQHQAQKSSVGEGSYISVSSIRAIRELLDAKDPFAMQHSERVAATSVAFGRSFLSHLQLNQLELAALLHELSSLSPITKANSAFQTIFGAGDSKAFDHHRVYLDMIELFSGSKAIAEIVRCKRLFFDGRNANPEEAIAEDILKMGRILSVVHAYDVLRFGPRGQVRKSHKAALTELRREAGTRLEPRLVEAFCEFCKANLGSMQSLGGDARNGEGGQLMAEPSIHLENKMVADIGQIKEMIDSMLGNAEEMKLGSIIDLLGRLKSTVEIAPQEDLSSICNLVTELNGICSTIRNTRQQIESQSVL